MNEPTRLWSILTGDEEELELHLFEEAVEIAQSYLEHSGEETMILVECRPARSTDVDIFDLERDVWGYLYDWLTDDPPHKLVTLGGDTPTLMDIHDQCPQSATRTQLREALATVLADCADFTAAAWQRTGNTFTVTRKKEETA